MKKDPALERPDFFHIFTNMKERIQRFGRSLSAMVMPNIGAFIAWGLITALFIPGGWYPNESLAKLVSPMLKYLLPTLIAFTAGKNVGGYRGGVAGTVAAMGVIIGTETPMFLGAMIMGPIAGWCVKRFDKLVEGKVKAGFEMLVDNFSLGIIAMLLSITGYLLIGNVVDHLTNLLSSGVDWMLGHKMNPLLAVLVDPAKVLFLNNAVNHGIMTPLGIQQAAEMGQSMLFLVDPNPGPGLGILLACWAFGKGMTRDSAPGAVVIQLFGGIHEIYFPYVLARPILLLAVMLGNIFSLLFFTITGFGLVAPASPGSIISIILMSPKGRLFIGILGVIIGTAVSFLLAIPMVKARPDFQGEEESHAKPETPGEALPALRGDIRKIVFACDAGMGSSALGATRFKAKLLKNGIEGITCVNSAVDSIPPDADIVVCQSVLAGRIRGHEVVQITNFISDPALDTLVERLKAPQTPVLSVRNILTGLPSESKEEAILRAGRILEENGYVEKGYAESMLERERLTTTYMGMGVAIPHGTSEAKGKVKSSGISVLQYPEGIDFEDEKAYLVIGIAGKGDEHLDLLAKVSGTLEDEETLDFLSHTADSLGIFEKLK